MPRLDPDDLRAYAARDWSITNVARAREPVSVRVGLGIALYEAMRTTRPGWPTDQDRIRDLESHCRVRSLLDRARHVGAR